MIQDILGCKLPLIDDHSTHHKKHVITWNKLTRLQHNNLTSERSNSFYTLHMA
jgi:hypothetical protein